MADFFENTIAETLVVAGLIMAALWAVTLADDEEF